jgi:LysM repeat protein
MHKALRAPLLLVISIVLTALCWLPAAPAAAQQGPPNLLVNGDFEAWPASGWPWQDGVPEVQISPGWRAFYVDTPPDWVTAPTYWKRPEFRDVKRAEYAYRVHGGYLAQKYFTFGGQHIAGLYQQVGGITPGTPLRFAIYMQTWSCMAGAEWNICPTGAKSNSPSPMHTRVGIDPYGGTSPWSPNIVWSAEINAYDQWTLFSVDAVAQAGAVTVFTYSHADWFDSVFRMANDVYVDDGSLVVLEEMPEPAATEAPTSAPTATPDPSLPTDTPAPTGTPAPTPTPRPDGAVVYVVREGDTLSAIAAQYRLTVDQILQLNDIADANVVDVGQEIVIAVPAATATPIAPTPTVALPTATPTFTATPQPTATALPPTPTATPALVSMATEAAPTPEAASQASASSPAKGPSILWLLPVLAAGTGVGFLAGRRRR